MDASKSDNNESEKKNDESLSYHSPNISSEWQITNNPMANSSSCSGAPMVDSFCSTIWDQPSSSQNLGFCEINVTNSHSLGMEWGPPNTMLKGGLFLPNIPGILPQIPADSGFIERAARFSSFNGGNFSDMMNPFTIPEPINPYFRGIPPIQRPHELSPSKEMNVTTNSKNESFVGPSEMVSDNAECSGRGGQEEVEGGGAGGESSGKGLSSKKRKRISQGINIDEKKGTQEPHTEDKTPNSTTTKLNGKQITQKPQTSDPTKEDYIHIRARRGQATNSHSLAERVRREKISERMKFLQDLVPGCSKVTGKAVMLDEIINYVQSLQRQVEFLSMKLATVNPRLSFNLESLLTKDIIHSRAGTSSSLSFAPDMAMHYPSQMHVGLSGMENSSEAIRRSMCSQFTSLVGGYKEQPSTTTHVPNAWEDELHNVVQMGINSISPLGSQDLTSLPPGHMKPEQ